MDRAKLAIQQPEVETTDLQCSRVESRRMSSVYSGQFNALSHDGLAFALELAA